MRQAGAVLLVVLLASMAGWPLVLLTAPLAGAYALAVMSPKEARW